MSKKVVFFFPFFASSEATKPLGILAVSTPWLRADTNSKWSIQAIKLKRKLSALKSAVDARQL